MSDHSLVSIVIPVYNRPQMLAEAVRSVQDQTWQDVEIIIIDDGSTDQTASVSEKLALHDRRVVVRTTENRGPGAARNAGIALSRGHYIQFLDSDDLLLPHKLADAVQIFKSDPGCDIVYSPTSLLFVDTGKTEGPFGQTDQADMALLPEFLVSRWWKTPTPVYRADRIREAGPILELITEEDWEFECRLGAMGLRLRLSERAGAVCRMHSDARLSRPDVRNRSMWRSRARAHLSVWAHAKQAQVAFDSTEVEHYIASMFLLARQCGAAGLSQESRELLLAALEAADLGGHSARQMNIYAAGAKALGWRLSGALAQSLDRGRNALGRARPLRSDSEVGHP